MSNQNFECTCIIDKSESIPSNVEARTGTPITGKGVSAATIPTIQKDLINVTETADHILENDVKP